MSETGIGTEAPHAEMLGETTTTGAEITAEVTATCSTTEDALHAMHLSDGQTMATVPETAMT